MARSFARQRTIPNQLRAVHAPTPTGFCAVRSRAPGDHVRLEWSTAAEPVSCGSGGLSCSLPVPGVCFGGNGLVSQMSPAVPVVSGGAECKIRSRMARPPAFLPLLMVLALCSSAGVAATYVIAVPDRSSRGWYDVNGRHYGTADIGGPVDNYFVGGRGFEHYRNFFIFPLPIFANGEVITAAELVLFCPPRDGYRSPRPSETFGTFAVDRTPLATLRLGGETQWDIFDDLGDGSSYSSGVVFTAASGGSDVTIPLNPTFMEYARANAGAEIAIGGALISPDTPGRGFLLGTPMSPTASRSARHG